MICLGPSVPANNYPPQVNFPYSNRKPTGLPFVKTSTLELEKYVCIQKSAIALVPLKTLCPFSEPASSLK